MNIKVFNIRLAKEFCQADEDKMNDFLNSVEVKLTAANFVTTGTKDFWSVAIFYLPKLPQTEKTVTSFSETDLLPNEYEVFKSLRKWRNELAEKLDWPSYRICHNSHLIAIAKKIPRLSMS